MEQQSNNKLDALFQKAAQEYPLKTNNKNWDVVAAKLRSTQKASSKNRKFQYAILILLFLGGSFFFISNLGKKQLISHGNQQNVSSQKNTDNNNQENHTTDKNSVAKTSNKNNLKQVISNTEIVISSDINAENRKLGKSNNSSHTELFSEKSDKILQQLQPLPQSKLIADNSTKLNLPIQPKAKTSAEINQTKTNKPENNSNKKEVQLNLKPQPKTFYGILFFSPDFATIKFQHINKPGYSIGIALGYRINKRISVELGLQRIHANFYSDGKYFDTSNIKLKPATTLTDLNGTNKLTTVPATFRFNLLKSSDHFFATAGTNIALITHAEKFKYDVIKNGTPRNVYKKFSALTGTKFFSSINLSLGYQASVSNFFDIKAEPYYQAAIKGLGIGNLPINNFGINIGIIKNLN